MTVITNTKFDGGLAESRYDTRANVATDMYHYDATTDPNVLRNFPAMQKDMVAGGNNSGTEAVYCYDASVRSNGSYIGLGINSNGGSTIPKFYRKNNADLNSYWQQSVSDAAPSTSYTPYNNGTFAFQTYVYGVCYTSGGSTISIYRYEGDSSTTSMGTISPTVASTTMARVTVHSQDATAYLGIGKTISTFKNTTITANVLTLPYTILSTCEYGLYLAILCLTDTGKGVVYLWGRNTSITTLQEIFLTGDDAPKYMYNINGKLVVISVNRAGSSDVNFYLDTRIIARVLYGGVFNTVKNIAIPYQPTSGNFSTYMYTTWKDTGYFCDFSNAQLYAVGFNQNGQFYIAKDRNMRYDGESGTSLNNFFNLGDYFAGSFASSGNVRISFYGAPLYSTIDSYWKTTANPGMYQQAPQDLPKKKQVKRVWARFYARSVGYGTARIKLTLDNGSELDVASESAPASQSNFVVEADTLATGDQLGSGRDIIWNFGSDQGIDLVDYGYEYDVEGTQAG